MTRRYGKLAARLSQRSTLFGDERLYVFLASRPTTTDKVRDQFARLAAVRLSDKKGRAKASPPKRRGRWSAGFSGAGWGVRRRGR
jgi:hypothetical protein